MAVCIALALPAGWYGMEYLTDTAERHALERREAQAAIRPVEPEPEPVEEAFTPAPSPEHDEEPTDYRAPHVSLPGQPAQEFPIYPLTPRCSKSLFVSPDGVSFVIEQCVHVLLPGQPMPEGLVP